MPRWFAKELPEQPIYIGGRPYRFDFIATEDAWLAGELSAAAQQGIGGIVEINQAQYDESIKKKRETSSSKPFPGRTEVLPTPFHHAPNARPAVVVGVNSPRPAPPAPSAPADPITVTPPRVFLPSVGKAPK